LSAPSESLRKPRHAGVRWGMEALATSDAPSHRPPDRLSSVQALPALEAAALHLTAGPLPVCRAEEHWSQFQAILAGLPMHAVPSPLSLRSCMTSDGLLVQCSGQRSKPPQMDNRTSKERIQDRLNALSEEYPEHQDTLARLEVLHANLDLVCLADHVAGRLFTAARGTDRNINPLTFPRDWGNNIMIVFGNGPSSRATTAVDDYRACRQLFPTYKSFGSGHSLGGAVMVQLAKSVEDFPDLSFSRLDVFNTAISPLSRTFVCLANTALHVHRTPGDWASMGLSWMVVKDLHVHPVKSHIAERHSLKHFLPDKVGGELETEADEQCIFDAELGVEKSGCELQRQAPGTGLLAKLAALSCVGVRSKASKASPLPHSVPLPALLAVANLRDEEQIDEEDDDDLDSLSIPSSLSPPSPRSSPSGKDCEEIHTQRLESSEESGARPHEAVAAALAVFAAPASPFSLPRPPSPPPSPLPEARQASAASEDDCGATAAAAVAEGGSECSS